MVYYRVPERCYTQVRISWKGWPGTKTTTLSITKLSITAFSIMTLSIKFIFETLSINDIQHNDTQHNSTSAIMLNIIMLNVVMLNVVMLNVVILSIVMLSVVGPVTNTLAYLQVTEKKGFVRFAFILSCEQKLEEWLPFISIHKS
jgi:hypothetical protein